MAAMRRELPVAADLRTHGLCSIAVNQLSGATRAITATMSDKLQARERPCKPIHVSSSYFP
jgi:hypothetical protein